jgi:hypothetical protein
MIQDPDAPTGDDSSISTTLTPISLNMASTSSICSELTSSEGNTEPVWPGPLRWRGPRKRPDPPCGRS